MAPDIEPREWDIAISNKHIDDLVKVAVDAVDAGNRAARK